MGHSRRDRISRALAALALAALVVGLMPSMALANAEPKEPLGEPAAGAAPATATAESGDFSYYTVEFTYGDLQYVLQGGEKVPLADILTAVGLVGEPTGVEVSDPDLFSAFEEPGGWVVSSHKAFSSSEWMRVAIASRTYEIAVTDWIYCGDNLTWELSDAGVLTISGTGAMEDFLSRDAPWYDLRDSIKSVVIEDGATSIGWNAFKYCSNLTSVEIPASVESIGAMAFGNCELLASVKGMGGVESIGDLAFATCDKLKDVYYGGSPAQWDGIKSAFTSNPAVHYMCGDGLEWTLSGGVLTISGTGAMWDYDNSSNLPPWYSSASSITGVVIGSGVTSIGDYAFDVCSSLTGVAIPSSVTSIGSYAFDFCSSLTDVYYGGSKDEWDGLAAGKDLFNGINPKPTVHCTCKVTFVDEDGRVLKGPAKYYTGTKAAEIAKPADPSKEADAQYTYAFAGWSPEVAEVTADATYKATYSKTPNRYEVTYKVVNGTWSDGGTTDKTETVQGGAKPASVPIGMKASPGYTGGAWDKDPTGATIMGATTFTYTFTTSPTIAKASISKAKVTLAKTSCAYDGKAKRPAVKSVVLDGKTLKAGADYAVKYTNNVRLGTATATVTGKGAYKDSAKATFTIALGKAKLTTEAQTKARAMNTRWAKVPGARKYQVQWRERGGKWKSKSVKSLKATVKGMEAGKLYDYRVRAVSGNYKGAWSAQRHRWFERQAGVKASSGKAGAIKVSWSKTAKANAGYLVVVRYSKYGDAVAAKTVAAGKTSATVKGLKPGKTAWVQVRALRNAGDTTYNGVLTLSKSSVVRVAGKSGAKVQSTGPQATGDSLMAAER